MCAQHTQRVGIGFKWHHIAVRVVVRVKGIVAITAQATIAACFTVVDIGVHCTIVIGNNAQNNALGGIAELVHLEDRRLKKLVVGLLSHVQQVHNFMLSMLVRGDGDLCCSNAALHHNALQLLGLLGQSTTILVRDFFVNAVVDVVHSVACELFLLRHCP